MQSAGRSEREGRSPSAQHWYRYVELDPNVLHPTRRPLVEDRNALGTRPAPSGHDVFGKDLDTQRIPKEGLHPVATTTPSPTLPSHQVPLRAVDPRCSLRLLKFLSYAVQGDVRFTSLVPAPVPSVRDCRSSTCSSSACSCLLQRDRSIL